LPRYGQPLCRNKQQNVFRSLGAAHTLLVNEYFSLCSPFLFELLVKNMQGNAITTALTTLGYFLNITQKGKVNY
jgi:hypothetical protein